MILVDSGPLTAILNRRDKYHARCATAIASLTGPLYTTLPVLTEAMYLLFDRVGKAAQDGLWGLIEDRRVQVINLTDPHIMRMRELMTEYEDVPMDFADASLVAAAESSVTDRVFTTDSHFYAYRMFGTASFAIIP